MEQSPKIIMQCPKCQREFPPDSNYCEFCSAMLEPVEIDRAESIGGNEKSPGGSASSSRYEKIEDVKIDSLRTDIEVKFVYTLFWEIGRLKKRLQKKQKALAELQNKKPDMDYSGFLSEAGEKEREIEETAGKISKLESILDNLKKKIEADISDLSSRVSHVQGKGGFWFLSENGRYSRMLLSELKTKNILMDIILGKRSPAYFRIRRLGMILAVVAFSAVLLLAVSWNLFTHSYRTKETQTSTLRVDKSGRFVIRQEDITALLEDIRRANLNKDIKLWESRYSKHYLELEGRRENLLAQWRKFDFRSLRYKVGDIKIEGDRASAIVTWEMELLSKKKTEAKIFSQRLYADFIIEDGRLKISSIRK